MYGSKIDHLIQLKEHNFPIPPFEIISFEEYQNGKIKERFPFKLTCKNYAVRSSSNLEDGNEDSFAGLFETYLNVSFDELSQKINECFASLNSKRVAEYIAHKNIAAENLQMNVLVQEMVNSELSGVIFCANPQGILNESVIVVGEGLGEGIVSDAVQTTSYYYNLQDEIYYFEGKKDYLSSAMVKKLIQISQDIQDVLGRYLDIEFAIVQDTIYILQARKITTLSNEAPLILDNSNIVESYPGISLPLTISFVNSVYSGVFESLSRRILRNEKELQKHKDVFKNMVGSANGRLYYKISNWYTLIQFLPFHKKIIPIWQEMLGVKTKSYSNQNVSLHPGTRIMTYVHAFYELLRTPKSMKELDTIFHQIYKEFFREFNANMNEHQVLALYEKVEKKLFACWDVTLLNDLYAFIFTGLLKKRLKTDVNSYISGMTNIESLKPIQALITLAYQKDSSSEKDYAKQFNSYIQQYGDRNLEELKLESLTFRTNPELLEERIEEYRKDSNRLKELYQNISAKGPIDTKLQNGFLTRTLLKKCMLGICNREKSRLNRSRIYGMVRSMMLQLGSIYQSQHLIDKERDIFYLTLEEVRMLTSQKTPMQDIIAKRKEDYHMFSNLPAYSRLLFMDKEFDKSHTSINNHSFSNTADVLKGIPCSNGIAEGEALVIRDIHEAKNVKDKILITKMTDPGWVFLLATAKGVISEKGSLLSHTAIISRELKIPSIVGVNHLLNSVESGDIIRMDGTLGTVEIIEKKETYGIH